MHDAERHALEGASVGRQIRIWAAFARRRASSRLHLPTRSALCLGPNALESPLAEPLRIFRGAPRQAQLKLRDFLRWVGGPAIFHLQGRDSRRCRVLCGGLHGNEPSGFFAIHSLLREPPELPVDTLLVLGNVSAALEEPGFYHRMSPGDEDMNRVWSGGVQTLSLIHI